MLTQSLNHPTQQDNQQLRKVLGHVRETLYYSLSLQPAKERAEEKAHKLRTCGFLSFSLDIRKQFHQHNLFNFVGSIFDSFLQNQLVLRHKKKQSLML